MRKVKIIKCSYNTWWYKNLIGKIINIHDKELKDDYIAAFDDIKNESLSNGYILKSDCVMYKEV